MPRPKKKDNVEIEFSPVNIELNLRVGDSGRITIPKIIQNSYGIKKDMYVRIKIVGIGFEKKTSKRSTKRKSKKKKK